VERITITSNFVNREIIVIWIIAVIVLFLASSQIPGYYIGFPLDLATSIEIGHPSEGQTVKDISISGYRLIVDLISIYMLSVGVYSYRRWKNEV
jgi:hypothetical protein